MKLESVSQYESVYREWGIRLLLISVSLLVALGLAEVMVRIFFPIWDGRDNVTLDGKPINSWFEPGTVYRQVSNEYDAITTITDKGHRVPGVDGNPDVIFVGDSFTFGFGLSDDQTFASIYCKELHRACVNLGYPGSGTLRQVERLDGFIRKYGWKPKEVKLFFFGMTGSWSSGNDFVDNYDRYMREQSRQDDTSKREPSVGIAERIIGMQVVILEHSTLMRRLKYHWGPRIKSILVADPGEYRMAIALKATKEHLAKLDELSRRVGFEYTIYLVPAVHDILRGTQDKTLAALNAVSPQPVVSTAQVFLDSPERYSYAFDGHLNPKGSKRIAEFLISMDGPNLNKS
ncbi:MAG: SGNH/GDSL hydrolase family protein [Nitrospiraceae bacterium]|uniref:SGNH/GDSL hydrolase family protein n=1 Tax=Nitrospira cf. moscoviensis SBR1015 TaxID=96242 RepID=UPI000A0EADB2|nr:SGNH/GDSL hydrolase family protein [Nitrospira cf. moscoviensis SBR1015]MBY0246086.1 SGNH/GDSL hydrolase family protein [Nitrospiraceae bacterium]OQW32173.1 MAG: hypothetical protein A4E20_03375 [Nitrospira sp. SG-bin2]